MPNDPIESAWTGIIKYVLVIVVLAGLAAAYHYMN